MTHDYLESPRSEPPAALDEPAPDERSPGAALAAFMASLGIPDRHSTEEQWRQFWAKEAEADREVAAWDARQEDSARAESRARNPPPDPQ